MHIEIEFFGDPFLVMEQYTSTMDDLRRWCEQNQVMYQHEYKDNCLKVTFPSREDFSLWCMTWRGPYHLICQGYEDFPGDQYMGYQPVDPLSERWSDEPSSS